MAVHTGGATRQGADIRVSPAWRSRAAASRTRLTRTPTGA